MNRFRKKNLASYPLLAPANDNFYLRLSVHNLSQTTTQNPYDIEKVTDTAATGHPYATQSRSYSYDLIDRLLTASSTTPGNSTFAYDKLDNATTYTQPPTASVSPTYNGFNQISTWGTLTYAYDANGNLTSGDGTKTYKYDAENRVIEIDYVGTSNKTTFAYDGLGHRISDAETVSGTTTTSRYTWCGSQQKLTNAGLDGTIAYETRGNTGMIEDGMSESAGGTLCQTRTSGDVIERLDYDEGEYNVTTSQKLAYAQDNLGSVRDVLDAITGGRVASYDYTPYGAVARSTVTNGTDYQYAQLFKHAPSTLNMATYRFQDGATGRFINRDPLREITGLNLYEYGMARPNMNIDPWGMDAVATTVDSANDNGMLPGGMGLSGTPQSTPIPGSSGSGQCIGGASGSGTQSAMNDNSPGGMSVTCNQGYQWCRALGGSFTSCGMKLSQCNQGISIIWGPGISR